MLRVLHILIPFLIGLVAGASACYALMRRPTTIRNKPSSGRAEINAMVDAIKSKFGNSMKKGP